MPSSPLWLIRLHFESRCRPMPIPSCYQPVARLDELCCRNPIKYQACTYYAAMVSKHSTKSGWNITFWFHLIVGSNDLLRAVIKLPGHDLEQQRPTSHGTLQYTLYEGFTTDSDSNLLLRPGVWPQGSVQYQAFTLVGAKNYKTVQVQQCATKCIQKLPSNGDSPARD